MKQYRIIFAMMFLLSFAVLAGCAASLPQQTMKLDAATAPKALEFVFVKGGCYMMGDALGVGNDDERPVHEVCVSDFYLGKYEVTQSQWSEVMGDNPSSFKDCGPDCPVSTVSWIMAQDYIRKLNAKSGKQYRLPTEAEWEYAARSGDRKERWAGTDDEVKLDEYAWHVNNSDLKTHKAGLKAANGIGLYDMSGNVAEWCLDRYGETYYAVSPKDDPKGPQEGAMQVLRGGSFYDSETLVRVTERITDMPDMLDSGYGFRLLLPAIK